MLRIEQLLLGFIALRKVFIANWFHSLYSGSYFESSGELAFLL